MEEALEMKRDFSLDALSKALCAGYGLSSPVLVPLKGCAHSLNFKVTDGATVFAAKVVQSCKTAALERLLAHTVPMDGSIAATRLFGGKVLDFGELKVMALRWIGGDRVSPDELDEAGIDSLVASYTKFLDEVRDDDFILPLRDAAALKPRIVERLKGMGLESWVRELRLVSDDSLTLDPSRIRVIHGDLHYENFKFADGKVSGFLDLEELRFGTPAEDIVRYTLCSAERRKWLTPRARRRLLAAFAAIVERMPLTRREWLFAIDSYLLRKIDRRTRNGRPPLFKRIGMTERFRIYRDLREMVYAKTRPERGHSMTVVKTFGGTVRRFMGARTFDWEGRIRFTCDPAEADYDWLCVYDELPRDWPELRRGAMPLRCPPSRTILATQEPVSVKSYNAAYAGQFARLLTNRPPSAEGHPGYVRGEGYMVWYTGRAFAEEAARRMPDAAEKTKGISVVCSSKKMRHTNHLDRFRLVSSIVETVPGVDWFGKGVRPLKSKYDALDPYKYHIAVENHVAEGHWTEKLADAIVCGCLTFYAGDSSVARILPAGSFIPIPIDDPARAAKIISDAVEAGEWERRRDAIAEARRLLLTKYNFFAQVAEVVESGDSVYHGVCDRKVLVSRRRARLSPRSAFSDLWNHVRRMLCVSQGVAS